MFQYPLMDPSLIVFCPPMEPSYSSSSQDTLRSSTLFSYPGSYPLSTSTSASASEDLLKPMHDFDVDVDIDSDPCKGLELESNPTLSSSSLTSSSSSSSSFHSSASESNPYIYINSTSSPDLLFDYPVDHYSPSSSSSSPASPCDFPVEQVLSSCDSGLGSCSSPLGQAGFGPGFEFDFTFQGLSLSDFPPVSASGPGLSPIPMGDIHGHCYEDDDGDSSSEPLLSHRPGKPHVCHTCGNTFTRAADLNRHSKSVHFPVFRDCPVRNCSRKGHNGFPRRDHLNEHLRSLHHVDVPKRGIKKNKNRYKYGHKHVCKY